MLPQTSTSKSREEMEQEIVQNLARELQELKGADAFALLLSTLDNIIPAITHVQYALPCVKLNQTAGNYDNLFIVNCVQPAALPSSRQPEDAPETPWLRS